MAITTEHKAIMEQLITELSDDTLKSYKNKAKAQVDALGHKRGPKSKAEKSTIGKRQAGSYKATKTIGDRAMAAYEKNEIETTKAFHDGIKDSLTAHGFTHSNSGPTHEVWTKHHKSGVSIFAKHNHPGDYHRHGALALMSSDGHRHDVSKPWAFNKTPEAVKTETHDAIKKFHDRVVNDRNENNEYGR